MEKNINLSLKLSKNNYKRIKKEIFKLDIITEETINSLLNYEMLLDEEKKSVDVFCSKSDFTNPTQLMHYGEIVQKRIIESYNSILEKNNCMAETKNLLIDLCKEIKGFDENIPKCLAFKGLLGKIFNIKKKSDKLIVDYNDLEINVSKIEKQLETQKIKILKYITAVEDILKRNMEYFIEISLYIIAGEKELDNLKNNTLLEIQTKVDNLKEEKDIQILNNLSNIISIFEKKLYDLKTARIVSAKMFTEVKCYKFEDKKFIEQIQELLKNVIPNWKNKVVMTLLGVGNSNKTETIENYKVTPTQTLALEVAIDSNKVNIDIDVIKRLDNEIIEYLNNVTKGEI